MSITVQQFRKTLDSLELTHRFCEPGVFLLSIGGDNGESSKFLFNVVEERNVVTATAIVEGAFVKESKINQAYKLCNSWNERKNTPKAYVHKDSDGDIQIRCEWQWDSEPEFSEDNIKQLIILLFVKFSNDFFKEVDDSGLYKD